MAKILAIIPAYNEEVALGSVIIRTAQYVDRIIVIDDGSYDKTAEVAKLAGAEVISHKTNHGKGKGLESGFNAVYDEEVIVTIDGDGQNNPDEIPNLVNPIINGGMDFINGSRYMEGTVEDDTPSYRRIGQKVLDKATNISSGLEITDSQSGFRAFSKRAISCFGLRSTGFAIESEMLSDAAEAGLKIGEVPITVRYDVDGSTENPITHGVRVLLKIIKDMELKRPLYYFTLPGFIITLIGFISSIVFLNDYINGTSINFGPTIISFMFLIVGLFLMLNGILLDSLRKLINRKLD
ncbi:MAG: glycosyltransferase family 2 protein [Methanobacteriaceae archaeon]